jgi:hypothetical protein
VGRALAAGAVPEKRVDNDAVSTFLQHAGEASVVVRQRRADGGLYEDASFAGEAHRAEATFDARAGRR